MLGLAGTDATAFDPATLPAVRAASPRHIDPAYLSTFLALHHPGAGMWNTAADLMRFGYAHLFDRK